MNYGNLAYYILGEVITCILSLILCCNIFVSFSLCERRHRLFMYGGISSFIASFFDILAVYCITYYQQIPVGLCTSVSTIYFLFLCTIPFVLCCYASDIAYSYRHINPFINYINVAIYTVYIVLVLLNIKTGWIFRYDPVEGYIRGPLKYMTYILTVFYSLCTVVMVLSNRKTMARRVFVVFCIYPFISLVLIAVQFFEPKIIMTGIAGFAALFFAYITIQSDLIDFDFVTGLMTENRLKKQITSKKSSGYLYVFSIDNLNVARANMEVTQLNNLLLEIAKKMTKCFERLTFHISSSRFAGLCKSEKDVKKAAAFMADYLASLNNDINSPLPVQLDVYTAAVSFSDNATSYENLMEIINNMFSKSKNEGTRTFQICDEAVISDLNRKRAIHKILKRELNLESEQFQVCFQPIYSLKEKKFTYMEALSRLNNTELGNISPVEFVSIAEAKGLIEKLGFVAFEKVCRFISQNKDLVDAVSINFSACQMTNPNLVNNVLETIDRFGLKPSNIIMEITESIFIENFELVRENMTQLANAGIKFYLDDFGTGYSNLSNVIGLPFSTIKFDRSLVLMMEDNKKAENLFTHLISTFKGADLKILVEGVETNNQNQLVEKAGADYIQGFLYSRPLPENECLELFRNQLKNQAKK